MRYTNAHEQIVGGTDGYHVVICGLFTDVVVGRDSSVGVATRYGLDATGIESRWGRDFSGPVQTDPGAHPASYTMGTGSLSRE
jgi:hypothetical protein